MNRSLAILLTLTLYSGPAIAHAPIKGIGAFYNGLLHPLIVPAHLLLLISLGLLLGQHAPRLSRFGWVAFVLALWVALAGGYSMEATVALPALLLVALLAAAFVMLDRPFAAPFAAVIGIAAGLGIGLDSMPDTASGRQAWLGLIGSGIGAVLILSYVGGVAAALDRPWQRIAIRVAGSWAAASSLIVLTLTVFHA
jgi:urease accessory protein